MKAIGWLMTGPGLMLAGMSAAHADLLDLTCRFLPWLQICKQQGGGGTVSVAEPEMLALFSAGLIVAGLSVMRRRKKQ